MRAGFILPQLGPAAAPQANVAVAQRAEALGYASLWVTERLLWPLAPQSPYPATPDGALPEVYQRALDPLETLTFVAAHTSRIGLGTSVLNMPFYNPVVLARRLTTLDVLSGGRLRVVESTRRLGSAILAAWRAARGSDRSGEGTWRPARRSSGRRSGRRPPWRSRAG